MLIGGNLMKIGLISDTHIPERASKLPITVLEAFKDVDLILHAGDITSPQVIAELEEIAPVKAVQGNMDRIFSDEIPKSQLIEVEDFKIGLNHGVVYPKGDTLQLKYIAMELGANIFISGHTHKPEIEKIDDILFLNPGSPTAPRLSDPSVMILEIKDGDVDVEIKIIGPPVCTALNLDL